MRRSIVCILGACLAAGRATAQVGPVPETSNVLTQFLDWADIHPSCQVGRLTLFPISLSRRVDAMGPVLTMQQALDRRLLVIEELPAAQITQARFINKSADRMVFLMAGEIVTGGKQNRTLASDALLAPGSTAVLPLYCVQKGRWAGDASFGARSAIAPQAVREKAAGQAGQDEVWTEIARANRRLQAETDSEDLAAAMHKPENVRQLEELRGKIVPHLPRGCVGVVVAVGGRLLGADLFHSPDLFADMRDKVLDSYLSEYGWPIPVRGLPVRPERTISAEQVREYLRDCYRSRFVPGEMRGVGRVYYLRGPRSGQTLSYNERHMVHTALTGPQVIPVRPEPRPRPLPEPRSWR